MKHFLFSLVLFSGLTLAEAYDQPRERHAQIGLFGGWSKVSKDFGFGGDSFHAGLDLIIHFNSSWYLGLQLQDVDMGKSGNTLLTQSSFLLGPGYRYKGLRTFLGLGMVEQTKDIINPSLVYVDPAPGTHSRVLVEDVFFAWGLSLAYDFKISNPSENFPWSFLMGPTLSVGDTFENNGFAPVFSAGLSLSLR